MRISSRYTTTKELVKECTISSINLMKVAWEFVKPKGTTIHSKIPSLYLKVFFHTSFFFYWDLVVARLQVNLTEVLGSLELVKKVINFGNWVLIPDCDFFRAL
jgi:hypothetical protein